MTEQGFEILALSQTHVITPPNTELYLFLCLSSLLDCELFVSRVWSTFPLVTVPGLVAISAKWKS